MADFIVEVTDSDGGPLGDAEAAQLRAALVDHGAVTASPAPEARFVDPATLLAVTVSAIQTAAAFTEVVNFLQSWRNNRGGRIRVAGAELPTEPIREDSPFVAAFLGRAGRDSQRRYALVVAVNSYDDPGLNALRSPATDARALSEVLSDRVIGGYQVEVLSDADERTVRRRIGEFFADRDPDDLLLLHFSCHGVKDRQNKLHLAARDTELRSLGATAIPASFVDSQMAQTAARRVVLILDCCFSGAYAGDMTARADRRVNIDDEFGHSGRVVLTASSATEYAFEGTHLTDSAAQPSIFTSALVDGLRTGNADLDGDGQISVDDWYTYAYRAVTTAGAGQAPTKSSSGVSGAFIVANSVRGIAIPGDLREDLESDRVPVRLAAVERLAALSARGGGARITARRELERLVSEDDSVRVRTAAANALGHSDFPEPAIPVPAPAPVASPAQPPTPVVSPAQRPIETQPPTPVVSPAQPPTPPVPVPGPGPLPEPEPGPVPEPEPEPGLVPKPAPPPVTVPSLLFRAAGVLLLIAAAFRVFSVSTLDSDELDLYVDDAAYSMELGVITLLALAGLALAVLPRSWRRVLPVVAGLAPWAGWTAMSNARFVLHQSNLGEPAFWARLPQLAALVFAVGLLLWTQRRKPPGNQVRGYAAFALAAVILVMAMVGTRDAYSPSSLAGPAGLAAAALSLTIVYFGAAIQELRRTVLGTWAVAGGAWLLTSGQGGLNVDESAGHPHFLPAATMVPLLLMLLLALVPWRDTPASAVPDRMPANLAKAAMGLIVGSLAMWILLSAIDWDNWPTSQLWLHFLPMVGAAGVALGLLRTAEGAAFLTGLLGWPVALIAALPVTTPYPTPTVQGGPAIAEDAGSTLVWGVLACAALLPTIGYLWTAPTTNDGPRWIRVAAPAILFVLGFATWMCWDERGFTYPVIAGVVLAAPTALLRNQRGAEQAVAVLAAATAAVPVLITMFIYGYSSYSMLWRLIACGVALAAFAFAVAVVSVARRAAARSA